MKLKKLQSVPSTSCSFHKLQMHTKYWLLVVVCANFRYWSLRNLENRFCYLVRYFVICKKLLIVDFCNLCIFGCLLPTFKQHLFDTNESLIYRNLLDDFKDYVSFLKHIKSDGPLIKIVLILKIRSFKFN